LACCGNTLWKTAVNRFNHVEIENFTHGFCRIFTAANVVQDARISARFFGQGLMQDQSMVGFCTLV
jgi:hypothetical protein